MSWYFGQRSEGDNLSPNTNLNFSQELVTKLTRHETSDLLHQASKNEQRSTRKDTSMEFKSRGQVSREARFLKSVEVGPFCVPDKRWYLKRTELPRLVAQILPCVVTLQPKRKLYWEILPSQCGLYGIEVQIDSVGGDDQHPGWSSVEDWTDMLRKISAGYKQPMYPEPRLSRTQVLSPGSR